MYPTIYPVYPFIIFPIKMKEQVCPLNIKSWVDKNNLSYDEILYLFKLPINSALFLLTILSMIYHGYLGMIIIVEDYIRSLSLRKIIGTPHLLLDFQQVLNQKVILIKLYKWVGVGI